MEVSHCFVGSLMCGDFASQLPHQNCWAFRCPLAKEERREGLQDPHLNHFLDAGEGDVRSDVGFTAGRCLTFLRISEACVQSLSLNHVCSRAEISNYVIPRAARTDPCVFVHFPCAADGRDRIDVLGEIVTDFVPRRLGDTYVDRPG